MFLLLVHHGDAIPKEIDPNRPLTEKGRSDLRKIANFLDKSGVRVERVLHSTKVRARETAMILAPILAPGVALEERVGICPDDPLEPFLSEIPDWNRTTLVAGHGPHLARLIPALLMGGQDPPLLATLPGSVVCLEKNAGRYLLAWMVRPEMVVWI